MVFLGILNVLSAGIKFRWINNVMLLVVFQPSERDPGACMMLVDLLQQAGCPKGVVNVIHGAHNAVDFICDNPTIRAVSFVGSDQAVSQIFYFSC